MSLSRRGFLGAATATAALGAVAHGVGATSSASAAPVERAAASRASFAAGDIVGKVTVGYQGWFAAIGDNSPIDAWWHWAPNAQSAPSPSNNGIRAWPDVSEYTGLYETAFANRGNGKPATLFSSYDQQTVITQFEWMQKYGCDTAALQRFNPFGSEGPIRNAITAKVRQAAEATGPKFYIMYDVSGWAAMQTQLKQDWTDSMSAYTSSPNYAHQDGKPVVCIWGFGFNDDNHDFAAADCLDVIAWFKAQGCYVIGGVPTHWRTLDGDSRVGFTDVYHAFDMLSPWMVGRIGTVSDVDNFLQNVQTADKADCDAHGIAYQPCVLPGDLSVKQRVHGDFMWRQFYDLVGLGVAGLYISMFDEYNEGNQIAKTAATQADVPVGSGFLSLDEDGTACSSDYYLRLTGDGGRMLKGQVALTATRFTEPVVGQGTQPVTKVVAFKAGANGLFVTADNAGASALIANRTAVGPWETFDVVDAGQGAVALRAHANGLYVTADNAGALPLIANRTAVGPWETFTLMTNPNGTTSLLAHANSKYVTAENAGAAALIANRAAIGGWEQFTLVPQD